MTSTFTDIISETHLVLSGYTQRQDQATYLITSMGVSDLSFTIHSGNVLSRGMVEIDDELIWVDTSRWWAALCSALYARLRAMVNSQVPNCACAGSKLGQMRPGAQKCLLCNVFSLRLAHSHPA